MKLNGDEYTFVHANESVLGGATHIDPQPISCHIKCPYTPEFARGIAGYS
jgi:hypothetical protein